MVGFMSHLLLDELYSIEWRRGRLRLKKSFGTAVKFWGSSTWANLSTYIKLAAVAALILSEPVMMEKFGTPVHGDIVHTAPEMVGGLLQRQDKSRGREGLLRFSPAVEQ